MWYHKTTRDTLPSIIRLYLSREQFYLADNEPKHIVMLLEMTIKSRTNTGLNCSVWIAVIRKFDGKLVHSLDFVSTVALSSQLNVRNINKYESKCQKPTTLNLSTLSC